MAKYKFIDHWYIKAPQAEVFRYISDARTYPQWWPVYPKVEILHDAGSGNAGSRARLQVKSALGYTLDLDVETVAIDPPNSIKTVVAGQLAGSGEWEFKQEGDTTHAIFTWIVESHHPLLNVLEPIAKPLFKWSHDDASRKGHRGLKKLLEKAHGSTHGPRVLENPISGEKVIMHKSARNSDGRHWEIELFIPAYKGKIAVAHFHPRLTERFEILEGQARYVVDGQELDAGPGDVITIPPGTAHIHPWSNSAEGLHLRQVSELDRADPAALAKFDAMIETLFGLAQDGKVTKEGQPYPLQFAVIARSIQPEGYFAGMPIPLQRLVVGALAGLGRLLGYKERYPEYEALS